MRYSSPAQLFVVAMLAASGCQNSMTGPTPKQQAVNEWNGARSTVLLGLASDQYKARDFEKASQTVAQALRLTPESAPLQVLAAKLAIEGGRLELAEQHLKLARKSAPNDAEALYLSGIVYQRWQKLDVARDLYHEASTKAPAEPEYLLAESEMLVATGQKAQALGLLRAKAAYFEHSGTIRDAIGQILVQLGRNAEAVTAFQEASILAEDDQGVRERLARAQFAANQNRDCAETLKRLLAIDGFSSRPDLHAMLGKVHARLGDPRAARAAFEAATKIDPTLAIAFQGLARAMLECGDLQHARTASRRSVALDARDGESQMLLGYIELCDGKPAEALDPIRRAVEINPGDAVCLKLLGRTLDKLGRHDEALEQFDRATRAAANTTLSPRVADAG